MIDRNLLLLRSPDAKPSRPLAGGPDDAMRTAPHKRQRYIGMPIAAGAFAARSDHSGGVKLLLLDGSARFVAGSVDVAVWRSIGSRAGGEPIDSTSF